MNKNLIYDYIKTSKHLGFPKDYFVYTIIGPILKKFIFNGLYDMYGTVSCDFYEEYNTYYIDYMIDQETENNIEKFKENLNKYEKLKKYFEIVDFYIDVPYDATRYCDKVKIKIYNLETIEDFQFLETVRKLFK